MSRKYQLIYNIVSNKVSKVRMSKVVFDDELKNPNQGQYLNDKNTFRLQKTSRNTKIDAQNFVEEYRNLKQQQRDFLKQINLSSKLKSQIFGCDTSRDFSKPAGTNEKLVALIDPFKGRLIIKQKDWLEIYEQREAERIKEESEIREKEERQRLKREREEKRKKQESQFRNQQSPEKQKPDQRPEQKKKEVNFIQSLIKRFSSRDHPDPDGQKYIEKQAEGKRKEKKAQRSKQKAERPQNKVLDQIQEQSEMNEARIQYTSSGKQSNSRKKQYKHRAHQGKTKIGVSQSHKRPAQKKEDENKGSQSPQSNNFIEHLLKTIQNDKNKAKKNAKQHPIIQSQPQQKQDTIRMQSRAKFNNNYNPNNQPMDDNDIYQIISEIPKTNGREDFSSPSIEARNFENQSLEDILRSKKGQRKQGSQF